jgi:HD-like signal output (HDOD) protein
VNPTIASIIASAGELSVLPDSWQRIDAVAAHGASSTAQIAAAIALDPGLSARLLRMANSPMFGLNQRVERLSQAVHLIGTRQLRELALAATVIDLISGGPGHRERIEAFLHHSTATGLCARAIASHRREANIERFFVAGLLHDLGLFTFELAEPGLAGELLADAHSRAEPLERVEAARLGLDHAAIGGALLQRWNLPASLSEAVAWHHQPVAAPTCRVEAAVVHIASLAIELLGFDGEHGVSTPLDAQAWELVGLDKQALIGAANEAEAMLAQTLGILGGKSA